MRTEIFNGRFLVFGACLIACSQLAAFEPGTQRTCEPSADGERFVCRDASGVEQEQEQAQAPESTPKPAAEPAVEPAVVSHPAKTPEVETVKAEKVPKPSDAVPSSTSQLPNYLFSNPGSASRTSAPAAAPAATPTPAPHAAPAPAPKSEPASTRIPADAKPEPAPPPADLPQPAPEAVPAKTPMAKPAATAAVPASVPMTTPSQPTASPASAAPAALPQSGKSEPTPAKSNSTVTKAQPAAHVPAPVSAPTEATQSAPRSDPASSSVANSRHPLSNASEFMALPGSHYTLVLDSARSSNELNALLAALEDLPGKLYLVALNMPDGRWYSLCWSDFENIDAARAARADLPADAPIASGWPRRISLLQSEIK